MKNGSLLFAYTRYRDNGYHDHSTADIYGIISDDDGESFGKPFLVLSCDELGADNIMSVSFVRIKNGDMGLFYLKKNNEKHTCIPYMAISSNEGKTWDKHIRCIEDDGYFVLNNDRVIVLDRGTMLMPVAKHLFEDGEYMPGSIYMYASSDEGETWHLLSQEIALNPWKRIRDDFKACCNAMEPGVVQLENGDVWCYIRTELGRQYETFSKDLGQTWDIPAPSPFTAPDSPMCVKKLKSGKLFAVWNPIPVHNGKSTFIKETWTGARTPLVFSVLDENGNYNSNFCEIENDEEKGFCYCAIHETDKGDILLGYCAGGIGEISTLNRLRIKKIYKEEIEF